MNPSFALSGHPNENVTANAIGNPLLIGNDSHHLLIDRAVLVAGNVSEGFSANRLALFSLSIRIDIDIAVLKIEFNGMDTVRCITDNALPCIVVVERNSPEPTDFHDLLDCSTIVLFLVVKFSLLHVEK